MVAVIIAVVVITVIAAMVALDGSGATAAVAPDGSSRTWSGKVVDIGLTEGSSSASTTYAVMVSLHGDSSSLRNGVTASVSIQTASRPQVIAVRSGPRSPEA